jgi:hypothetical protein
VLNREETLSVVANRRFAYPKNLRFLRTSCKVLADNNSDENLTDLGMSGVVLRLPRVKLPESKLKPKFKHQEVKGQFLPTLTDGVSLPI